MYERKLIFYVQKESTIDLLSEKQSNVLKILQIFISFVI